MGKLKMKTASLKRAESIKTEIDETVAQIREHREHLLELRQAYCRAKNPNLKEGAIYSYSRSVSSEIITGQLFMDTAEMDNVVYGNYPYRLRLLKKDGTIGGMVRVVYDPERLKYIKD